MKNSNVKSINNTRILFVLEYFHPHKGGVEYLFKRLSQLLAKRGYKVTVLTRQIKNTKKKEIIDGVNIIRINTINRYLFSILAFFKLLFIAKHYDIMHTTTFTAAFPTWIAAKFWKKPCVMTVHEVWINNWHTYSELSSLSAYIHNFLEKIIYLLPFNRYIAVSNSTVRQLMKIKGTKEKITMIYNGFDSISIQRKHFNKKKIRKQYSLDKAFIYFSWGRPGVSKGHEYLLKAVPQITKKIPNAKLLLMLSDKLTYRKRYSYLVGLIRRLNIQDHVFLIESLSNKELWHYIKAADCVVIPSLSEGFGYAVLEACSIGTPVVASNTTSIPEVIHGKYILVEPKNPEAIAEGVWKIYQGKYQTTPLKKFSWDDNVKKHEELYRSLL